MSPILYLPNVSQVHHLDALPRWQRVTLFNFNTEPPHVDTRQLDLARGRAMAQLKMFNQDRDRLVLMGDPAHIAWCCWALAALGIAPTLLKWDKQLQTPEERASGLRGSGGYYDVPTLRNVET